MRKNQLKKSLERGSGESLSSERFPPIKSMTCYISITVMPSFYNVYRIQSYRCISLSIHSIRTSTI